MDIGEVSSTRRVYRASPGRGPPAPLRIAADHPAAPSRLDRPKGGLVKKKIRLNRETLRSL
jgi:hypothetical protein